MSSKRIEQLIDDIYEYIESCKPKGFSGTQVIVPKEELYDLLDEMRLKVPDEIKRCQKMIANRDAIIANAEERAEKIISDAKIQADALVHESEIMRQAYLQANEMVSRATEQANGIMQQVNSDAGQIRSAALDYTNEMLEVVEQVINSTLEDTKVKTEALITSLQQNLEIVTANRRELSEQSMPEEEGTLPEKGPEEDYDGEPEETTEYDIDSDAFLRNID